MGEQVQWRLTVHCDGHPSTAVVIERPADHDAELILWALEEGSSCADNLVMQHDELAHLQSLMLKREAENGCLCGVLSYDLDRLH